MKSFAARVLRNRYLHLGVGVLIIASAGTELLEEIRAWENFDGLDVHHGVALVGAWHVIQAVSEIFGSAIVIEED